MGVPTGETVPADTEYVSGFFMRKLSYYTL